MAGERPRRRSVPASSPSDQHCPPPVCAAERSRATQCKHARACRQHKARKLKLLCPRQYCLLPATGGLRVHVRALANDEHIDCLGIWRGAHHPARRARRLRHPAEGWELVRSTERWGDLQMPSIATSKQLGLFLCDSSNLTPVHESTSSTPVCCFTVTTGKPVPSAHGIHQ